MTNKGERNYQVTQYLSVYIAYEELMKISEKPEKFAYFSYHFCIYIILFGRLDRPNKLI